MNATQNFRPLAALSKISLLFLLTFSFYAAYAQFGNPLFIPPTLEGTTFNLTLAPHKAQFLPGDSTETFGINQPYLGPTLIMHTGDFLQMHVTNLLDDTTTMHWHGMHVAPEDDGGPHSKILPGETWSPDFEVLDEATTFWYHPHLHHKTAQQVYKGAAGMIIVRDEHEATLDLPRTYGVDDFPLVIQDKTFDENNQFIFAAMNDTIMVNGTLSPFLEVPAQMVRFRMLNGSNQRVYNFALPPNLNGWHIGSDGGLLESPVPLTEFSLAPGERAEIVIDFGGQQTGAPIRMPCNNSGLGRGVSGGPNGPSGPPGNQLDGNDFDFMEFRIIPPTPNGVTSLSPILNSHTPFAESEADVIRTKVFDTIPPNSFPFLINSVLFDHHVVNDVVYLDDIEIWEIVNETSLAHPFHIHDIQFYILDINGMPPPPHLRGKKDVILSLPGDRLRFITKFDDFVDPEIPYMYHCHNLFHEDAGMMGQFIVVEAPFSGEPEDQYVLYPNPTENMVKIMDQGGLFEDIHTIRLVDLQGKVIMEMEVEPGWKVHHLDLTDVLPGIYSVQLLSDTVEPSKLKLMKLR